MTNHDFTRTFWGHNISMFKDVYQKGGQSYVELFSWDQRSINVGDTFTWVGGGNYGVITAEVVETKGYPDPRDMAFSTLRVLTVLNNNGNLAYEAPPVKVSVLDKVKAKLKR